MKKKRILKALFLISFSIQCFAFNNFNEERNSGIYYSTNNSGPYYSTSKIGTYYSTSKMEKLNSGYNNKGNVKQNINLENIENINEFIKNFNVNEYKKYNLTKGVSSIGMIIYKKFIERKLHLDIEDFLDSTRLSEITSKEVFNKVFEYKNIIFLLIDKSEDLTERQKIELKKILNKLYANKRINHLITFLRRKVLGGISENCQ